MKAVRLPDIDARYWAMLMLAAVFGANTGGVFVGTLGFGNLVGLVVLLAGFGLVLAGPRRIRSAHEGWFWLGVIGARTVAAVAVASGQDAHWNGASTVAGCALLLAATTAAWRWWRRPPPVTRDTPALHPLYWSTMLIAATLGTAIGDYCAAGLGFGNLCAAALLAPPLALALLALRGCHPVPLAGYWAAVVEIFAVGTAAGGFLADDVFGLALACFVTGVAAGVALAATQVLGDGALRRGEQG